jgi:hypothetical protein
LSRYTNTPSSKTDDSRFGLEGEGDLIEPSKSTIKKSVASNEGGGPWTAASLSDGVGVVSESDFRPLKLFEESRNMKSYHGIKPLKNEAVASREMHKRMIHKEVIDLDRAINYGFA